MDVYFRLKTRSSAIAEIASIGGRSRPFKVTDISTKRKLACDFLLGLMKNTNAYPSRADYQLPRNSGQIIAFDKGCLVLIHSFSVTPANSAINRYAKTRFFPLHFCGQTDGQIDRQTYRQNGL